MAGGRARVAATAGPHHGDLSRRRAHRRGGCRRHRAPAAAAECFGRGTGGRRRRTAGVVLADLAPDIWHDLADTGCPLAVRQPHRDMAPPAPPRTGRSQARSNGPAQRLRRRDLVHEAITPRVARLERPDHRMPSPAIVRARVPPRRGITAPHMATAQAKPQADPLLPGRQTFFTAVRRPGCRCALGRVSRINMHTIRHSTIFSPGLPMPTAGPRAPPADPRLRPGWSAAGCGRRGCGGYLSRTAARPVTRSSPALDAVNRGLDAVNPALDAVSGTRREAISNRR